MDTTTAQLIASTTVQISYDVQIQGIILMFVGSLMILDFIRRIFMPNKR